MITLATLRSLIAQGESEMLDFKRSTAKLHRAHAVIHHDLSLASGYVAITGAGARRDQAIPSFFQGTDLVDDSVTDPVDRLLRALEGGSLAACQRQNGSDPEAPTDVQENYLNSCGVAHRDHRPRQSDRSLAEVIDRRGQGSTYDQTRTHGARALDGHLKAKGPKRTS